MGRTDVRHYERGHWTHSRSASATFRRKLWIQRQTQHLSSSFFGVRQGAQGDSVTIGRLKMHWNGVMNACADATFAQENQQLIPALMRDNKQMPGVSALWTASRQAQTRPLERVEVDTSQLLAPIVILA